MKYRFQEGKKKRREREDEGVTRLRSSVLCTYLSALVHNAEELSCIAITVISYYCGEFGDGGVEEVI